MKIFIIEDEPAIREELTQLFEKYGYQCASSSDFQHIAETALSSGADLILLDINLPYQDGINPIFQSLCLPAETAILTN